MREEAEGEGGSGMNCIHDTRDIYSLKGRTVKILAPRNSMGEKMRDRFGLTGEIGVVISADDHSARVRLRSGAALPFEHDRIAIVRQKKGKVA